MIRSIGMRSGLVAALISLLTGLLLGPAGATVRLNEFVASNGTILADEDGDFSDWIEIVNVGAAPVALSGFGLTDNPGQPFQWTFPAVTLDAGQHLLVWASGKNRRPTSGPLHTNFSIAAGGEPLRLTRPDGSVADELAARAVPRDLSLGRSPDGTGAWFLFDQPTPGAANTTPAYIDVLAPPVFSHEAGFHPAPFNLTFTAPDPLATILYTLDGSDPHPGNLAGTDYLYKNRYPVDPGDPFGSYLVATTQSQTYAAPLAIVDRTSEPDRLTGRSTTIDRSPDHYTPVAPVFKGSAVRARAVREGYLPSDIVTRTFFVAPGDGPRFDVPVVSLVVPEDAFYDYTSGIHVAGIDYDTWRQQHPTATPQIWNRPANFHRRGPEWEVPAHVEFYETPTAPVLAQAAGIRIHGGGIRAAPRKSLRLYARSAFSDSSFAHSLFPDLPYTSYRRLLLRNGGNDWGDGLIRDAFVQVAVEHLRFDTQSHRPAVVFLNGEYWGLYNLRERFDENYLARVHGVDPGNVDMFGNKAEEVAGDLVFFNTLAAEIATHGIVDEARFAAAAQRIDFGSLMDYSIAQIHFANTDTQDLIWRERNTPGNMPDGPRDGRLRWMLYDMDFGAGYPWGAPSSHDTLAWALDPSQDPATWFLLRHAVANARFRDEFIHRFADLLNTMLSPVRLEAICNGLADEIAAAMPEHIDRWRSPANLDAWRANVATATNFAHQRPSFVRQHLIHQFNLGNERTLTLDVSNPGHGHVRINTMDLLPTTPGVATNPYPWSGVYFANLPVVLEAIPAPGYRFSHWTGLGTGDAASESVSVSLLDANRSLVAHFAPEPTRTLLHYWNFNNATALLVPSHTLGGGELTIALGGSTAVLAGDGQGFAATNAVGDDPAGTHLRVNNPIGATVRFNLPTTGYRDAEMRWETRRSGQGAGTQIVEFSTNGSSFVEHSRYAVEDSDPVVRSFAFASHAATDDNPNFAVRVRFEQGDGSTTGNNRFDNVTLTAFPLATTNTPPVVTAPPALQQLIEGAPPVQLDLATIFADEDPLVFTATSSNPAVVALSITGSLVTITPLQRGDARVEFTASDALNPTVATTVRYLVHPQAHRLLDGAFAFGAWDALTPERTYPAHMLFLQTDVSDPTLAAPLLFPYFIPHDDYHPDDQAQVGFPYATASRTRLNGLGADGVAFINTGRGRDLGGALVALDTRGVVAAEVSWLAATVLRNTRLYAIRLQYRIGPEGEFADVLSDGEPVEYLAATDGDVRAMSPVALPAEMLGHEYVQLLWRYHFVSGASGARSQLRLDDLTVRVRPGSHWLVR
ncbi:MAG: CotH kinase family protein [Candidatus Sumerlaeia bacterium]|nr:CotH kinase family protein [Candidatus Sumerlaeia bacterium]